MRKIVTREEKEKREKRNKIILGIILVGIMIISTAGYSFFSREKRESKIIEHNGIRFVLGEEGLWHFNINNYEFATYYNPKEVENMSVKMVLSLQDYSGKPLYFSYDSDYEGINEVTRNIGRFTERMQRACLDDCKEDFPVKNCTDNVIAIKPNENLIKQENNCVYIFFQNSSIKAADAFIFKILKII